LRGVEGILDGSPLYCGRDRAGIAPSGRPPAATAAIYSFVFAPWAAAQEVPVDCFWKG
jgi:hypothetical protein